MYKIIFLLSLLISTGTSLSAQNQIIDREDLLAALELVFSSPETDPLYQHPLSEGLTLVLSQPDRPSIGNRRRLETLFQSLNDNDFRYFDRPVQIFNRQMAQAYDIDQQYLTQLGLAIFPSHLLISLQSAIIIDQDTYFSTFSLTRESEDDDWEIIARHSEIR